MRVIDNAADKLRLAEELDHHQHRRGSNNGESAVKLSSNATANTENKTVNSLRLTGLRQASDCRMMLNVSPGVKAKRLAMVKTSAVSTPYPIACHEACAPVKLWPMARPRELMTIPLRHSSP